MLQDKIMLFDGGLGSEITKLGLTYEAIPEELNITNPEAITGIHKAYVLAGADFITTNTFGANPLKIKKTKYSLKDIISAAITDAKNANPKYVMFDIGPLGQLLEPLGTLSFDEAYEAFKEIVLLAKDEVDGFILETFTDIYELKAAILAVKENSNKPVFATMSFDKTGRTLTGTTPEIMVGILEGLGVDALGINCSLGPNEMKGIVKEILSFSNTPVIVQPNRGLPRISNGKTIYDLLVEDFYNTMEEFVDSGVMIIGGCCGTTPEFIKALSKLKAKKYKKIINSKKPFVCTSSNIVYIEGVKVIGERLNPTGKKTLKQAIINEDYDYIIGEAIKQEQNGANILDINVGLPKIDEVNIMNKVCMKVSEYTDLPLQIDSSNPKAIENACRHYNGIPLINSVNGSTETIKAILPIVKKYGAMVIGLTLDENGVPKTALERLEIAKRILNSLKEYGISKEKLVIDTLVLTASAEQALVKETIKALKLVKDELGLPTALGVSNVSFGLPNRGLLNKTFLTMAMTNGLNLPIINPSDAEMINAISAYNVLAGYDINSDSYITKNSIQEADSEVIHDLKYVIKKGLKEEATASTIRELEHTDSMDVISNILIPTLNEVGKLYEKGDLFLPQLLKSAEATKVAFEAISKKFPSTEAKKGPIMLLTVKGDVHDIGKNIVKVILESYGYKVYDLGKDVDYKDVIKGYYNFKPKAIGLSALMTTTVVSMEETIKQLKAIPNMCPIFVGGAVLTQDIANEINADYYSKDALEFVHILEKVMKND